MAKVLLIEIIKIVIQQFLYYFFGFYCIITGMLISVFIHILMLLFKIFYISVGTNPIKVRSGNRSRRRQFQP